MAKRKSFSDDGWAIWVVGDDTSTFYLNKWVNPQGNCYVDVAVRIRGIKETHELNIYIPFELEREEIEDLSYHLKNENVFRAIFSTRRVLDYMKTSCTSELAYHGKTVDLIHLSACDYTVAPLAEGTLLTVPIDPLVEQLANNEAYFMFRLPHKNLNQIFKSQIDMEGAFARLGDLLATPVVSEKYVCSVRVNESPLLPEEINQIGAFHRQKLNKVVVTISLPEDYQVKDSNCYRIHRVEKDLYETYAPADFNCEDAVTYEWNEIRSKEVFGHFNFYFELFRNTVSKTSLFLYMVFLFIVGLLGDALWEVLRHLWGW